MQTFLPFPDYEQTAVVLDYKRLGKQRVEAKQILMALNNETKGWVNHPATKMWKGHEFSLANYGLVMCTEWISRGFNDSLSSFFLSRIDSYDSPVFNRLEPDWLGLQEFHVSHQSNLIRKDEEFYSPIFPNVPNSLPYFWPV
jgi:hypothetical protein